MPSQITISLIKIMNWTNTQHDTKVQISFLSAHNKSYIAHKSVLGSYIDNTLLLNTSFKISYQQNQHNIICKVAILKQYRGKQVVGQAELDLECFINRKIQYLTFNDKDKVIQIHRFDQMSDRHKQNLDGQEFSERDQQSQHNFLQQRYSFLDKITNREIQLKKDFSQKVYNLLKDIKYARASDNLRKQVQDKKSTREKSEEYKYQTPARQNQEKAENNKKMDSKINQLEQKIALKNQLNKPGKPYKLMIDSIQAYGKKEAHKQVNGRQLKGQKQQYEQEQEGHVVIPVKKMSKQIRSIYKN